MSNAEVTITINADGSAEVGVSCVKGADCKKMTEAIEKALGTTTKSAPTSEMYEKETSHVKNTH